MFSNRQNDVIFRESLQIQPQRNHTLLYLEIYILFFFRVVWSINGNEDGVLLTTVRLCFSEVSRRAWSAVGCIRKWTEQKELYGAPFHEKIGKNGKNMMILQW